MKRGGFTLMEVLVAVAILAIIGVAAARSLGSLVATGEALQKRQAALARLEIFFTLVDQDLRALVPRKIDTADGVIEPFRVSTDPLPTLEIIRAGLGNEKLPPGPLRVVYGLKDGVVSRRISFFQGRDKSFIDRDLLRGVNGITLLPVGRAGADGGEDEKKTDQVRVPAGVSLSLDLAGYGTVSRLFYIGVGE